MVEETNDLKNSHLSNAKRSIGKEQRKISEKPINQSIFESLEDFMNYLNSEFENEELPIYIGKVGGERRGVKAEESKRRFLAQRIFGEHYLGSVCTDSVRKTMAERLVWMKPKKTDLVKYKAYISLEDEILISRIFESGNWKVREVDREAVGNFETYAIYTIQELRFAKDAVPLLNPTTYWPIKSSKDPKADKEDAIKFKFPKSLHDLLKGKSFKSEDTLVNKKLRLKDCVYGFFHDDTEKIFPETKKNLKD